MHVCNILEIDNECTIVTVSLEGPSLIIRRKTDKISIEKKGKNTYLPPKTQKVSDISQIQYNMVQKKR